MDIHPRLAGGLIGILLIIIFIIIDKVFHTNICSNDFMIIAIGIIGAIVYGIVKRKNDD